MSRGLITKVAPFERKIMLREDHDKHLLVVCSPITKSVVMTFSVLKCVYANEMLDADARQSSKHQSAVYKKSFFCGRGSFSLSTMHVHNFV